MAWRSHTQGTHSLVGMNVRVTRHIDYAPTTWILRADAVGIDLRELKSTNLEAAKQEALHIVRSKLQAMLAIVEAES